MSALNTSKVKQARMLLGVLVLLAVVTIVPQAFAQVSYTNSDNPHGPLEFVTWGAGMGVAGIMVGFGVYTAIRGHR